MPDKPAAAKDTGRPGTTITRHCHEEAAILHQLDD